jgi:hypothetical protein
MNVEMKWSNRVLGTIYLQESSLLLKPRPWGYCLSLQGTIEPARDNMVLFVEGQCELSFRGDKARYCGPLVTDDRPLSTDKRAD